jgi:ribonuclease BN (tRNA processing enzyme)
MTTQTQIVLLGTGTPNAEPDRAGSSLAVVVDEHAYLFDLGPGVVRRAQAAVTQGVAALAMPKLTIAFLTHLHTDHTLGCADFLFTPWVLGRVQSPQIFGPPGAKAMVEQLTAAYAADIRERTEGLEPANATGYQAAVEEIEAGPVYADERVQIIAFAVRHGSWPAFGYRCESADRTIVISGDTAPFHGQIDQYTGCDVLVHEVYSARAFAQRPPAWQRYHAAVHTSTAELAQIASAVKPDLLVLVHQLCWGVSEADLVAEVADGYAGRVVSGRDLAVY